MGNEYLVNGKKIDITKQLEKLKNEHESIENQIDDLDDFININGSFSMEQYEMDPNYKLDKKNMFKFNNDKVKDAIYYLLSNINILHRYDASYDPSDAYSDVEAEKEDKHIMHSPNQIEYDENSVSILCDDIREAVTVLKILVKNFIPIYAHIYMSDETSDGNVSKVSSIATYLRGNKGNNAKVEDKVAKLIDHLSHQLRAYIYEDATDYYVKIDNILEPSDELGEIYMSELTKGKFKNEDSLLALNNLRSFEIPRDLNDVIHNLKEDQKVMHDHTEYFKGNITPDDVYNKMKESKYNESLANSEFGRDLLNYRYDDSEDNISNKEE